MDYSAKFNGWDEVTLNDLLVAYRKAKADCYYENTFPTAIKFAEYEQSLVANLNSLLDRLKNNKGFYKEVKLLGDCRLLPKKLRIDLKSEASLGHAHFSDPNRAFNVLDEKNDLTPEFRVIGDFPVDTHVISALWINMVGHKFDTCLDDSCYGARLRRIRNDEVLDKNAPKPFHITATTSFTPYFQPYKQWRKDGLDAIRNELELDRKVIAVSLDLRSYYHLVDPGFFATKEFQEDIGLKGNSALSNAEYEFTDQLSKFLQRWARNALDFATVLQGEDKVNIGGGLVIGLTVTRVLSNVLLNKWDRLIREKVTPIHYGRYVDDMFMVMHDPGNIESSETLMDFLQQRLGKRTFSENPEQSGLWEIRLGKNYQKESRIQLQAGKQKLFILEGQGGCDLLDSIEKEIIELSSERRLMPSPDQLEHSTAAHVLSASAEVGEQADALRRADGLTIRRLSWSLQLSHVETLANDLPANAWKTQREDFYAFAHNHILRPEKLFEHYSYLPRLLGFAIGMNEWEKAEAIVNQSFLALEQLEKAVKSDSDIFINGSSCKSSSDLWRYAKGSLTWAFIDAAAKNYPSQLFFNDKPKKRVRKLASVFMAQLLKGLTSLTDLPNFVMSSSDFDKKAPLLALTDLAKKPYKRILASPDIEGLLKLTNKTEEIRSLRAFSKVGLLDTDILKDFLKQTRSSRFSMRKKKGRINEGYKPYLFPTRPYTPSEITGLDPRCVGLSNDSNTTPQDLWAQYVRVLRGVWVKPSLLSEGVNQHDQNGKKPRSSLPTVQIGMQERRSVIVAITNIATSDECWAASACGKPHLTLDRYKRIAELINQAIKLNPKPDYLIFPELSLPRKWINSIARKLMDNRISLIAGAEYHHQAGKVSSEACMELLDDRLGYPSSVRIIQPKLEPAVKEDEELTIKFGLNWVHYRNKRKPVYKHNGFHFGIMVCSELQNSKARIRFQGLVDALIILSWNKDLDTFSALVEAAALDVHAYTILVNNRRYGDSRVRSPDKESFRRDVARLRGGINDFCVAVELDIEKLRSFQSRAKRWPDENAPFKPVPEGFRISDGPFGRKMKPPK